MITQGMAWWYRAYAREQSPQERGQYEFAEQEAKARKVGLWRDSEPVAPWNWRKLIRESNEAKGIHSPTKMLFHPPLNGLSYT